MLAALLQASPAKSTGADASSAELSRQLLVANERIAELEEADNDWKEEVDELKEEISCLRESWVKMVGINEDLSRKLQALAKAS